MVFFGHFWAEKCGFFGDGGSQTLNNVLQKPCITRSSESTTLKIGYGALQLTTHAPKMLF